MLTDFVDYLSWLQATSNPTLDLIVYGSMMVVFTGAAFGIYRAHRS